MRIVIIARLYWPQPGAASVRLKSLAEAFIRDGHSVVVITTKSAGRVADRGPSGEQLIEIGADAAGGVRMSRALWFAGFVLRAAASVRRLRPDILITDPPPIPGYAILSRRPSVMAYYLADSWYEMLRDRQGWKARLIAPVARALEGNRIRRADLTIAVTHHLTELAISFGSRRAELVFNGTDNEVFADSGPIYDDPWAGRLPYFIYTGNYGVVHGATVFLEAADIAWRQGLAFGLIFMGWGSDSREVEEFAARHPESFASVDAQPDYIAASALRGAAAALVSVRPWRVTTESRPAKLMAAISCGCPVIFAGESGFSGDITSAGLGLVTAWDPREVAAAMEQTLRERAAPDGAGASHRRREIAAFGERHYSMRDAARQVADYVYDSRG